jgi:hypothetical protein
VCAPTPGGRPSCQPARAADTCRRPRMARPRMAPLFRAAQRGASVKPGYGGPWMQGEAWCADGPEIKLQGVPDCRAGLRGGPRTVPDAPQPPPKAGAGAAGHAAGPADAMAGARQRGGATSLVVAPAPALSGPPPLAGLPQCANHAVLCATEPSWFFCRGGAVAAVTAGEHTEGAVSWPWQGQGCSMHSCRTNPAGWLIPPHVVLALDRATTLRRLGPTAPCPPMAWARCCAWSRRRAPPPRPPPPAPSRPSR